MFFLSDEKKFSSFGFFFLKSHMHREENGVSLGPEGVFLCFHTCSGPKMIGLTTL